MKFRLDDGLDNMVSVNVYQAIIITVQLLLQRDLLAAVIDKTTMFRNIQLIIGTR